MTTLRNKMVPIQSVILAIFVNPLTMLTRQASAYRGNQKYQSETEKQKEIKSTDETLGNHSSQ